MIKKIVLDKYDWKLYIRSTIFITFFSFFIFDRTGFVTLMNSDIVFLKVYHVVWLGLMAEMIVVFFPKLNVSLGCGKVYENHFVPIPNYSQEKLEQETKRQNQTAITVAGLWTVLIAGIGALYKTHIIDRAWLIMISLFFYLSDQICVNIWCPFRKFIMKNKCCNACRIFNWGHIMMFSPLVFIPSIWTWSLVLVSIIITLQWEITHIRHPERFSEISNAALKCVNCNAKCKWLKREKAASQRDKIEDKRVGNKAAIMNIAVKKKVD